MKVALSSRTNTPDAQLDLRFGRCAFFSIFDTESDSSVAVENVAADAAGGAGGVAAQLVHSHGVTAVVSGNYGPHAVDALKAFGIKMFLSTQDTVLGAYEKYKAGQLAEALGATVVGKHAK